MKDVLTYVQISSTSGGWADQIIFKKHEIMTQQGIDSYVFWGWGKPSVDSHQVRLIKFPERHAAALQVRMDGKFGFHNILTTRRLLAKLDQIDPDIVHIHALNDFYLNVEMLFQWLESHECQVKWTLHDCWAFTGYCMHYTCEGCTQWQMHCSDDCPAAMPRKWPGLRIKSRVAWCFDKKKAAFTSLPNNRLTLVAPSNWMAEQIKKSFLKKYPVEVVHNTVDETLFRPTDSHFREENDLTESFIILGVASLWGDRKGLDDFLRLAVDLDSRYCIVLVGLSKKQIDALPTDATSKIIGIKRTSSRQEMAALYSAADIFFNPTKEDNYPTVNLEAQACGTPVITYNVGGCKETLSLADSLAVTGYHEALHEIQRRCLLNKGTCQLVDETNSEQA